MILASGGGLEIDPNAPLLPTMALVVFLLGCSFFFSGTETALFSLQAIDRQQLVASGRMGALVGKLLGRRAATLTTILMGNELANIALAATTAALILRFAPEYPWLNVVVLTPVLVLVSEITPKFTAIRTNRAWSLAAAGPLSLFLFVISPVRWVFERLVIAIARLFRADPVAMTEGLEEAELMVLVDRGAAAGELGEGERELIENVFELDDVTIDRVMTPRPDIFAVPIDIDWDTLIATCAENRKSRVPVYESSVDDVAGILLVKDLLRLRDRPDLRTRPGWLRGMLRRPIVVPTSKPADSMFREFVQRKHHMAIVIDEHGTLVGLVTLDDLVRELLGIADASTEDSEITNLRPDTLTVRASIDLEDFQEETGIELPEGEYHTVGGFVFHCFGRLPNPGEAVDACGMRFLVKRMDGRRISEVEISHLRQAAG
ncbi:MAG: HlyC/CorC family transporter [Alphaproteobacteria bacterium]|nr:HlyC/CorC family transporter [Alphaproteobacteria bacterium]MCB9692560.1 HlyC/CorC family transporter [Alphaproteobacteria bacterium]